MAAKSVSFALGTGDGCTATTDASGRAACAITPNQPAGTVPVSATFAGDLDYLGSSDTKAFEITRQETTTTYTGPLVIAAGQPVTLRGSVVEEAGPVPVEGRSVTLALGSQSCTGTTDATGSASCVIASVATALGPQPLGASFAGDAFYEPSSDRTKQAIVFAFPSRGVFTVGDRPASPVTWWANDWSTGRRPLLHGRGRHRLGDERRQPDRGHQRPHRGGQDRRRLRTEPRPSRDGDGRGDVLRLAGT